MASHDDDNDTSDPFGDARYAVLDGSDEEAEVGSGGSQPFPASSGLTTRQSGSITHTKKEIGKAAGGWLEASNAYHRLGQFSDMGSDMGPKIAEWRTRLLNLTDEFAELEPADSGPGAEAWKKAREDFEKWSTEFDENFAADPRKSAMSTWKSLILNSNMTSLQGKSREAPIQKWYDIETELLRGLPAIVKAYKKSIPSTSGDSSGVSSKRERLKNLFKRR